jgi:hypothetical protein
MLTSAGWAEKNVNEAFIFINNSGQPVAAASVQPSALVQDGVTVSVATRTTSAKIIGIILFVVLLLGAGSAAAYYYFQSQLLPSQVLNKTFAAMQNVKIYSFAANVTSTIQVPTSSLAVVGADTNSTGQVFLSANATGSVDMSDLSHIQQSLALNVSANTGTTPVFGATIEYIALDNIYYIKIDDLNIGAAASSTTPNPITAMVQFFIGSWFKIDPVALQKTFGGNIATTTLSQIQSSTQLSANKIDQLKSIAAQYPILSVSQTLPSQVIGGQDTYHYELNINKDNLNKFITAAYPVVSGQSLSGEQIASATAAFDNITVKDLEVWIGKNNFLIYKISANIAVQQDQSGPADDIQFSDLNSGYNQPVNIIAPDGAKDVAQILEGFLGGFASPVATSTARTKSVGSKK